MKLTEGELKAIYAEATGRADVAGCPDAGALAAASLGELAPAEREAVAGHLASCSACAEEFRLLAELRPVVDAATGAAASPDRAAGGSRWTRLSLVWRAAAAVVLVAAVAAVALVAFQASRSRTTPPIERGDKTSAVATVPANRAELDAPPAELSWTAVPGATAYRVTLYDFESTPIWQSPPLSEARAPVPAEVRARLPRGKPIFWRVAVTRGVDRQELGPFQFLLPVGGPP
jgi:hypothetical protein